MHDITLGPPSKNAKAPLGQAQTEASKANDLASAKKTLSIPYEVGARAFRMQLGLMVGSLTATAHNYSSLPQTTSELEFHMDDHTNEPPEPHPPGPDPDDLPQPDQDDLDVPPKEPPSPVKVTGGPKACRAAASTSHCKWAQLPRQPLPLQATP